MPFSVNNRYETPVVEIRGKFLGSIEGGPFREELDRLKQEGRTHVVVDLSKADFTDSSGLGALIAGLTTMRNAGGDIRLAGVEKQIKNLFLVTRVLGPVFTDYPTVEEAVQSYRTSPPAPATA